MLKPEKKYQTDKFYTVKRELIINLWVSVPDKRIENVDEAQVCRCAGRVAVQISASVDSC